MRLDVLARTTVRCSGRMEEAELTDGDDASRIGWVQVGLNVGPFEPIREPPPPVLGQGNAPPGLHWRYESFGADRRASEPVEVLPALIQCFDDSPPPLWGGCRLVRITR